MKIILLMQLLLLYGLIPGVWLPNIAKYFVVNINISKYKKLNKTELLESIYNKINQSNKTMLICYNPYCPHCEHLLELLKNLNCSPHMQIIKVNIDNDTGYKACEQILGKYNIDFEGVPTILVFDHGRLWFHIIGFVNTTSEKWCGKPLCPMGNGYVPTRDVIKGIYCLNRSLISRFI